MTMDNGKGFSPEAFAKQMAENAYAGRLGGERGQKEAAALAEMYRRNMERGVNGSFSASAFVERSVQVEAATLKKHGPGPVYQGQVAANEFTLRSKIDRGQTHSVGDKVAREIEAVRFMGPAVAREASALARDAAVDAGRAVQNGVSTAMDRMKAAATRAAASMKQQRERSRDSGRGL